MCTVYAKTIKASTPQGRANVLESDGSIPIFSLHAGAVRLANRRSIFGPTIPGRWAKFDLHGWSQARQT